MKSPLKQLRELYLTSREKEIMEKMGTGERCEFQNDNCNYCYSDVSGSEDGYETTGATYDRSREYYCSSSLPESQNPHMNVNSFKIDQNKHGRLFFIFLLFVHSYAHMNAQTHIMNTILSHCIPIYISFSLYPDFPFLSLFFFPSVF